MSKITPEEFQVLLPLVCEWAVSQEKHILENGVALKKDQIKDAKCVGVSHPEKVRLLKVYQIPLPEHPDLRAAVKITQLISPKSIGFTLRYGIFIRSDLWGDRPLIVHELVHTFQYEKLGGFLPFLQRYLQEYLTIGYSDAPMEQEADRIADEICI